MDIMGEVSQLTAEVLTVVLGTLVGVVLHKVRLYLDNLKKKDQLGIIDKITDSAVEYAEAELTGAKGKEKRDFAISKATGILQSKGINISEDEIIAGIENGVRKLNVGKPSSVLSIDGLSNLK